MRRAGDELYAEHHAHTDAEAGSGTDAGRCCCWCPRERTLGAESDDGVYRGARVLLIFSVQFSSRPGRGAVGSTGAAARRGVRAAVGAVSRVLYGGVCVVCVSVCRARGQ